MFWCWRRVMVTHLHVCLPGRWVCWRCPYVGKNTPLWPPRSHWLSANQRQSALPRQQVVPHTEHPHTHTDTRKHTHIQAHSDTKKDQRWGYFFNFGWKRSVRRRQFRKRCRYQDGEDVFGGFVCSVLRFVSHKKSYNPTLFFIIWSCMSFFFYYILLYLKKENQNNFQLKSAFLSPWTRKEMEKESMNYNIDKLWFFEVLNIIDNHICSLLRAGHIGLGALSPVAPVRYNVRGRWMYGWRRRRNKRSEHLVFLYILQMLISGCNATIIK